MKRILLFFVVIIATLPIFAKSVPGSSPMTMSSSRYVVKEHYDLQGQTLEIPEGVSLVFKGGSLSNGTVEGHHTFIKNPAFENIHFTGTFTNDEVTISEETFGGEVDLWGILTSFPYAEIVLEKNLELLPCTNTEIKPVQCHINGKGHTIKTKNFPMLRDSDISITNAIFDCEKAGGDFIYGIGKGNSSFEVRNCSFINVPEISCVVCARHYSRTMIEGNTVTGTLADNSKRKAIKSRIIFIYDCFGDVTVKDNTVRNAFGMGISGINFDDDPSSDVKIQNNTIENVTNGGIVINGGVLRNALISGNQIVNTHCYGNQFQGESGGAENSAINVHGFRNLSITDNIITDCINSSSFDFDGSLSVGTKVEKGTGLICRGNKVTRSGGAAFFVIEDAIIEGNSFTMADSNEGKQLFGISGSSNVSIQNNVFNVSKGKAKSFYPIYITDTRNVKSGKISIEGNIINSDDKHFIFINTTFAGDCKVGENEVRSSGRTDGTLFIVNNSKTKVEIPKNSKLTRYR